MIKNLLQFLLPCWLQYSRAKGSVKAGYNYVPRVRQQLQNVVEPSRLTSQVLIRFRSCDV